MEMRKYAKKGECIIGTTYGDWLIIKEAPDNKHNETQCKVKCKCGFIKNLELTKLKNGRSSRCKACTYKNNIIDLKLRTKDYSGKTFHNWKVEEKLGRGNYTIKSYFTEYRLKHTCGEISTIRDFYKFR